MKHIIEWLIEIEKSAYSFYTQSATLFSDPVIKAFLEHSAQDEALHYRTMSKALETVDQHANLLSAISLDHETKNRVEKCFKRSQQKVDAQSLTIESLIDCIVETELSEWNHIFTYVVNSLKTKAPEFKEAAARIQHHLRHMEHFLTSQPYGLKKIDALKELKSVWEEQILVVDDRQEILTLLSAVLKDEGTVDTAINGKIALDKIRNTYYQLIISDVDMPAMNGLDFFRHASSQFPGIEERFIFLTGNLNSEAIDLFRRYKLKHLTKPATLKQIREMALESMHKISIAS